MQSTGLKTDPVIPHLGKKKKTTGFYKTKISGFQDLSKNKSTKKKAQHMVWVRFATGTATTTC